MSLDRVILMLMLLLPPMSSPEPLDLGKAMKSSTFLGPFCGSEFWGFSLLKIKKGVCVFMFQT